MQNPACDRPDVPAKIVFFASHAAGGIMELLANLAAAMALKGHQCSKMAIYPLPGPLGTASGTETWSVLASAKPESPLSALRTLLRMALWLRRERPDIVVCAMQLSNVLVPLMARLFSPHTRVIVTHHTPVHTNRPAIDWLDGLTGRLSNVARIVCVSRSVLQSLDHKAPGYLDKTEVITNALPPALEQFAGELAKQRMGRNRGRMIVVLGRLAPEKNVDTVLRAIQLVPDCRLTIIGDGSEREALEALARQLGISDHIVFAGHRPRSEALEMLAGADVFVQVSLFEGHSLALIEAARLGLALIVSDHPSQRDAITLPDGQLAGIALPYNDHVGLADALAHLFDDPAAMASAGQRAFTLAQTCSFATMLEAYDKLLSTAIRTSH